MLRPGGRFVLDMKDHVRGGVHQPVSAWHAAVLTLGLVCVRDIKVVDAPGMRHGANAELRCEERVIVFDKQLQVEHEGVPFADDFGGGIRCSCGWTERRSVEGWGCATCGSTTGSTGPRCTPTPGPLRRFRRVCRSRCSTTGPTAAGDPGGSGPTPAPSRTRPATGPLENYRLAAATMVRLPDRLGGHRDADREAADEPRHEDVAAEAGRVVPPGRVTGATLWSVVPLLSAKRQGMEHLGRGGALCPCHPAGLP